MGVTESNIKSLSAAMAAEGCSTGAKSQIIKQR